MGDFIIKDKQTEIVMEIRKTENSVQENSQALLRIWVWARSL